MAVGVGCQITDLTVNDHACLTFGDGEELFDLTAAVVRDGLSGGLKVVWLSEAGPGQATAELERRGIAVEPALAAGQMAAAGSEASCCRAGVQREPRAGVAGRADGGLPSGGVPWPAGGGGHELGAAAGGGGGAAAGL